MLDIKIDVYYCLALAFEQSKYIPPTTLYILNKFPDKSFTCVCACLFLLMASSISAIELI